MRLQCEPNAVKAVQGLSELRKEKQHRMGRVQSTWACALEGLNKQTKRLKEGMTEASGARQHRACRFQAEDSIGSFSMPLAE